MISIRDQAEAERKKLEDQREKSIRKAKEEAKRIVENAKRESEAMIAELRAMKKAGGAQEHEIQKVKKQMEKAQDELADKKEVGGEIPKSVTAGDMVHIASMDVDATIVAPADSKGYVQLKVGMMKMRAPLSDLRTLTATQQLVKKEQKKLERKKSMREARVDITTRAVRQELNGAAWRWMKRFRGREIHRRRDALFARRGQHHSRKRNRRSARRHTGLPAPPSVREQLPPRPVWRRRNRRNHRSLK